jgi:N-acetylmuramoyl-L-alanine amidase
MSIKTTFNYSPNFSLPKRKKNQIKFIIIHYTGMKSEVKAIQRLTEIQSMVSSHFFVKKNGKIITMVPESYIAWHAGESSWGKYDSLNKNSIGVEISNQGHEFGYKNFSKSQIRSLIRLLRFLCKKYNIKKNYILGHSDIAPTRKLDPGEKFPWDYLAKNKLSIWHNINKRELKRLRELKCEYVLKKIFFKNLYKIGYPKKIGMSMKKYSFIVKAFQRRFRPQIINGRIDRECLLISQKLIKFNK